MSKDQFLKEYNDKHSHCPICNSNRVMMTMAGIVLIDEESYYDSNEARCMLCGWIGVVHNLVERWTHE